MNATNVLDDYLGELLLDIAPAAPSRNTPPMMPKMAAIHCRTTAMVKEMGRLMARIYIGSLRKIGLGTILSPDITIRNCPGA